MELTRNELKTLFYIGRQLELIGCYVPMKEPQPRTVKEHRSYGFDMLKPDGKVSRMDWIKGGLIEGISPAGNGYTEVIIRDERGEVAAHYRLL